MKRNATALSNMKVDDERVMVMNTEDDVSCSWIMPGCWRAFVLPSVPPRLEIPQEEIPPKSVRFSLDHNTTHYINPAGSSPDEDDKCLLFFGRNEMRAAELDMEVTARYFRRLYGLDSSSTGDHQKAITSSIVCPEEVSSTAIGLEWLIWRDDRLVERRQDILEAIQFYSNNSLACICQVISSVSRNEARQRAEKVVQELKNEEEEQSSSSNAPTNKKIMTKEGKHFQGQWIIDLRNSLFQERRIPSRAIPETYSVPKEICTPPAA